MPLFYEKTFYGKNLTDCGKAQLLEPTTVSDVLVSAPTDKTSNHYCLRRVTHTQDPCLWKLLGVKLKSLPFPSHLLEFIDTFGGQPVREKFD